MSYHGEGFGQETTFSLEEVEYRQAHPTATDAQVAAYLASRATTTTSTTTRPPAPTGGAKPTGGGYAPPPPTYGGGGKGAPAPTYGGPTPITSVVMPAMDWTPWAIGGAVAVVGLGLLAVAMRN